MGLVSGADGYPSAEVYVDEWLTFAMNRTGLKVQWKKSIDDPYFAMAICIIRMTQLSKNRKCEYLLLEDALQQKARNAARWRKCAKQGVISDEDGQFRYYLDEKGTWQSSDGQYHVDNVELGF